MGALILSFVDGGYRPAIWLAPVSTQYIPPAAPEGVSAAGAVAGAALRVGTGFNLSTIAKIAIKPIASMLWFYSWCFPDSRQSRRLGAGSDQRRDRTDSMRPWATIGRAKGHASLKGVGVRRGFMRGLSGSGTSNTSQSSVRKSA
jgi:hypothetical protein